MIPKTAKSLVSIHEACQELHRLLQDSNWYINVQVMSKPRDRTIVSNKAAGDEQELVVYVRTREALEGALSTFKTWSVRYELGA